ncbi:MAG: alpha/beta hydrolase [Phycisphaerales bacterium]|nr:alpha/beta hydrolase [Phycisphaerales bacterium]
MEIFLGLAFLVLAAILAWVALTLWVMIRVLRHPPRRSISWALMSQASMTPDEAGLHVTEWGFCSSDGTELPAWSAETGDSGPLTVLLHDLSGSRIDQLDHWLEFGTSDVVIAYDRQGHGEAEGICRLAGQERQDLAQLLRQQGSESIRLVGHGLGASLALDLARDWQDCPMEIIAFNPWPLELEAIATHLGKTVLPFRPPVLLLKPALFLAGVHLPRLDAVEPSVQIHLHGDDQVELENWDSLLAGRGAEIIINHVDRSSR